MTVIVKPSAPVTADDIVSDYLTRLLGTLDFASFAPIPSGEITILDVTFKMRVGKFLGVPTGAIIAAEQFVKMKPDPTLGGYDLKVLDPKDPDSCLYDYINAKSWQPPPSPNQPSAGVQQAPGSAYGYYQPGSVGRQMITAAQRQAHMQALQDQKLMAAAQMRQAQAQIYTKPTPYGTMLCDDDRDTRSWWQKLASV